MARFKIKTKFVCSFNKMSRIASSTLINQLVINEDPGVVRRTGVKYLMYPNRSMYVMCQFWEKCTCNVEIVNH